MTRESLEWESVVSSPESGQSRDLKRTCDILSVTVSQNTLDGRIIQCFHSGAKEHDSYQSVKIQQSKLQNSEH